VLCRASKKSAISCADFYTKKEIEIDAKNNNQENSVGADTASVAAEEALGPRSVSLVSSKYQLFACGRQLQFPQFPR
jgi:hypothetical protein